METLTLLLFKGLSEGKLNHINEENSSDLKGEVEDNNVSYRMLKTLNFKIFFILLYIYNWRI